MKSVKPQVSTVQGEAKSQWTFLTNHAHVLVCLKLEPGLSLRAVAQRVGITERAVQRIIAELEAGGVLERRREGRRNVYRIRSSVSLRHDLESHCSVGDLLRMVAKR